MAFTFKQLRYFMAVVETGKVSDAAVAVNISPSSITESIKDLEYYLGTLLFTRSRTGLQLTQEGYRFLAYAQRILGDVENAKDAILDDQSSLTGRINIGVSITVAGYFLAGLLQKFRKSFPNIDINVIERPRLEIEKMVGNGSLDIAVLLTSNTPAKKNHNIISLIRSERRLWTSADHLFAGRDIVTLEEISTQPYIQLLIDEAEVTTLNYWKKYNMRPNVTFKTESVEAVRSLVATGAGITILSDMVHRPWSLEGEKIETIAIREKIDSMDTGLVWNSKHEQSELLKCFINFCRLRYTSGGLGGR